MANQLQSEKSPYLLQHAENPVDWLPWGPAALEEARRRDMPIFLSIGYSTCHWCHVMAHESFESEDVAAALNRSFIPVKVDREERPDVDAVYMAACIAMNGSGGWPLTVLLTPEQKPFWAGTYLPKEQLLSLLEQAARRWRENREELTALGNALTDHLRSEDAVRPGAPSRALVEEGVAQFSRSFDRQWGGFGQPPKFPTPHNLLFLLRYAHLTGDRRAREMAEETLEHMYRGGLFDHVGGGFSRYSTDRQWLVPHFEKMLYDNALLALAYTEAYQLTRRDYEREVVRRTLDYVLDRLTDPSGGFYCGQDADSDGVEGKYYVFSPEEMETLRRRISEYRQGRTRLHLDDKVLTSWNGLMIAALARAGLVLDEPRYLEASERAAAFIGKHLKDGRGRLLARWRQGEAAHPGKLEDYAFYAWGLLELLPAAPDLHTGAPLPIAGEQVQGISKCGKVILFIPKRSPFT